MQILNFGMACRGGAELIGSIILPENQFATGFVNELSVGHVFNVTRFFCFRYRHAKSVTY